MRADDIDWCTNTDRIPLINAAQTVSVDCRTVANSAKMFDADTNRGSHHEPAGRASALAGLPCVG